MEETKLRGEIVLERVEERWEGMANRGRVLVKSNLRRKTEEVFKKFDVV
jgi:hypothetical protein